MLLIMMAGMVFGKKKGWIGQGDLMKVSTESVELRSIIETVTASGKIYPATELGLTADVSGEIISLEIEEGDTVKQGQLLVKINPDLYQSMVERAKAAVNTARSNESSSKSRITQLQPQINKAKRDLDRSKELFDADVVSEVEFLNAQTVYESLQADLITAEQSIEASGYQVKSSQATLKEAQDNLKRTNLYAPMSGIVSVLNIEEGERVVGTSQFQGTELMRIANFNLMELQVEVSENDVIKVNEGDTAIVEVDAYYDREFLGQVSKISNAAALNQALGNDQVTNFTVRILLNPESYEDLMKTGQRFPFRPGFSASADIQTNKETDILTIPIQSVTTRALADSLQTDKTKDEDVIREVVFVYSGGEVEEREVHTGMQDETYIHIKEGLKKDEEVVNAPYRAISKKLEHGKEVEKVEKEKLFKKDKES